MNTRACPAFLSFCLLAALPAAQQPPPASSPTPTPAAAASRPAGGREILEGALAHYRALPELSCEGEADPLFPKEVMGQLPEGVAEQMRVRFTAALQGERCAFRANGPAEQSLVSDGRHVLRVVPMLSIYERKAAAKRLDPKELAHDPFTIPGAAVLLALRAPASSPASLTKATKVDVLGTENVGKVACHHLEIELDERTIELWIRQGDSPWVERWREEGKLPPLVPPAGPPAIIEIAVEPGLDCRFTGHAKAVGGEKFATEPPDGHEQVEDLAKALEARMGEPDFSAAPDPFGAAPQPGDAKALVGKPAPEAELTLVDGTKQALAAARGKVVVLDFWATTCKPCVAALPIVARVVQAHAERGAVLYTVDSSETKERIEAHLKKAGLDVPVALDRGGRIARQFGVTGVPHLLVIGRDGTVRASHIGLEPGLEKWLERELEAALAQPEKDGTKKNAAKQDDAKK